MKVKTFQSLNPAQQHTLLMAMLIRIALENFHAAHLSDVEMKQLNQLIRYSVYDAVELIETVEEDPNTAAYFGDLVVCIPDYWEIPGRDPRPKTLPG